MKCLKCKKELTGNQKKYCSKKCCDKGRYQENKAYYKENANRWKELNQSKARAVSKKAVKRYISKNREEFNKSMNQCYHKSKDKWKSRSKTYRTLLAYPDLLNKKCKKCSSEKDLWLHYEIYPQTVESLKKAIKDKKVYYLCKKCRRKNDT